MFTAWLDGVDHDTNGLPSCPEAAGDRAALEALYNATDGPNWMDNTNWLDSTVALGEWYGVSTDASGRVVGLDLSGRYDGERGEWIRHGLSGEIPPELGSLANLGALYLHGNNLSGSIPSELGNLGELAELNLAANNLSGSIPSELGNLAELVELHLGGERLLGLDSARTGRPPPR